MTNSDKRFYLACAAMQGICSNPEASHKINSIVESAIEIADTLLAQLAETEPKETVCSRGEVFEKQKCDHEWIVPDKFYSGSLATCVICGEKR